MAHGHVTVSSENSYQPTKKSLPVGYSWTVLFFGCFPALFRQDWKNFLIMAGTLFITGWFGLAFIPLIIFSFIYNDKMCLVTHLQSGYKINKYYGKKSLEEVSASSGYNLSKYMAEE